MIYGQLRFLLMFFFSYRLECISINQDFIKRFINEFIIVIFCRLIQRHSQQVAAQLSSSYQLTTTQDHKKQFSLNTTPSISEAVQKAGITAGVAAKEKWEYQAVVSQVGDELGWMIQQQACLFVDSVLWCESKYSVCLMLWMNFVMVECAKVNNADKFWNHCNVCVALFSPILVREKSIYPVFFWMSPLGRVQD